MSALGNKQIMAKNIQYYMDLRKKTRQDICDAIGVKYTTLTDWVKGNSYPRIDKIELMANYFGISKSDLVEDHSIPLGGYEFTTGKYRIPIVATVAAGEPIYSEENIEGWIDYDKDPRGHIFACRIKGDSMSPRIQDGDVIIVDEESDWEDGDIILATVNGNDGTCKRIRKYADSIALLSLNPAYDPMIFSAEQVQTLPVEIKGKVVQFRADL